MLNASFALGLARPEALLLALAMLPVAFLYFLRMRFRRKSVGSTYIWKTLVGATSGGDAMRRRSVLLLLLQLAAIALAAFAAAGPSLVSRTLVKPGTVYIIDVSASMAARDCTAAGQGKAVPVSRVEAAKEAALGEIAALGSDVPVMAFACASSARALAAFSGQSRGATIAALKKLSALSEGFAEAPCADTISAWLSRNEGSWQACLITDGGLDLGGKSLAAVFGGSLRVITVGTSGASLGATGLRLERKEGGGATASFTLWNGWPSERPAALTIVRGAGDRADAPEIAVGAATIKAVPGWSRATIELAGSVENGAYSLLLKRDPADLPNAPGDVYRLSVSPRPALSVLVVGRDDPFLKAALAYGGISYTYAKDFPSPLPNIDVAIVESAPVPANTRCHLLVFGDPPSDAPIVSRSTVSGAIASTEPSHPLSRFVDWEGAKAENSGAYALRGQALVLATVGGAPALVAWERDGYRSLACGIDLARSDLGLKSAFPILLQNFFTWCVPAVDEQSAYTLVVGETAARSEGASFKPKDPSVDLVRSGPRVALTAKEPGFFEWESSAGPGKPAGREKGYIAANVPAGEIDATPRTLQIAAAAAAQGTALAAREETRSASLGPWLVILLAVCLAGEWLAWMGKFSWPGAVRRAVSRLPGNRRGRR